MLIGELAARSGVTTKTIRYYEDIGLVPAPGRLANGYRDYPDSAVGRLQFIRDAQATGLTLSEIGSVLDLRSHGESTCHHVTELLERHLEDLDRQIARLRQTRTQLKALTERARELDPADCTDPNRCQTIVETGNDRRRFNRSRHEHAGPHAHQHPAD